MRRLVNHSAIYGTGTVARLLTAAAAVPIITRTLTPKEYGVVAVTQAISIVLAPLVTLGLPVAQGRVLFGEDSSDKVGSPDLARRLLRAATICAAGWTLVLGLITALVGNTFLPGQGLALELGILTIFPGAVGSSALGLLQYEGRPASFVAITVLGSLGVQVAGIGSMAVLGASPAAYLGGVLAVSLLVAFAIVALARGLGRSMPSCGDLRAAFEIGLPTVPHGISIYAIAMGDRLVVQALADSAEVARYQVAYALGSLSMIMMGAIQTAWAPLVYATESNRRWSDLSRTTTYVVGFACLTASITSLAAPVGLRILAPASYDLSKLTPVAACVAAATLPWALYLPMAQVLFWTKTTRPLAWIAPSSAVLAVSGAIAGYPLFGLTGVALATVAAIAWQAWWAWKSASVVAAVPWHGRRLGLILLAGCALISLGAVLPTAGSGLILRLMMCAVMLLVSGIIAFRLSRRTRV